MVSSEWIDNEISDFELFVRIETRELKYENRIFFYCSRCRVDIPPPTLLIGSDVIKVVPKDNNLGFILNEDLRWLITSRRRVKRYIGFCVLWGHMHWIHRLKLGGGWLCHLLCLTLNMGVLCMLRHNEGWTLLLEPVYGTFILWGGLIMCPPGTQWALHWLIILGFSFCRLFTKCCMSDIRAICSRYFFASSALFCDESVLCWTWLLGVECAASWECAVRRMVRGVDASDWVIYFFLHTFFVSVAPITLLDVMTVCYWGFLI
jgi:hypothetical protein